MSLQAGAFVVIGLAGIGACRPGAAAHPLRPGDALGIIGPQLLAVSVADLDASARWYGATFRLEPLADRPGPDGTSHTRVLGSASLLVELSHHRAARSVADYAGTQVPTYLVHGFFKAGFAVTDLDQALLELRRRGVETLTEPRADSGLGLRYALLRDNSGNYLQVLEQGGGASE